MQVVYKVTIISATPPHVVRPSPSELRSWTHCRILLLQLFHHLRQPLITIHHILNLVGRLDRVGLEFEVIDLFPYPKGALGDAVFQD